MEHCRRDGVGHMRRAKMTEGRQEQEERSLSTVGTPRLAWTLPEYSSQIPVTLIALMNISRPIAIGRDARLDRWFNGSVQRNTLAGSELTRIGHERAQGS